MNQSTSLPRKVVQRTRGLRHGAITRLMSPSDLGKALKPFVFLDLFDSEGTSFSDMALHPHSGIATLTYMIEGSVRYEDTSGAAGILPEGGVEWFKAAHGAWHGGGPNGSGRARGFQLWIALPPDQELGQVESIYQAAEVLQRYEPAIVLLGKYGGVSSLLEAPSPVTYLFVRLKTGEMWRYRPPSDHTVCWVALSMGSLEVPERLEAVELAVFESSNQAIYFYAEAETEFVLGSAASHPYELAVGDYSVHTSPASLQAGERRIAEIQARLQKRSTERMSFRIETVARGKFTVFQLSGRLGTPAIAELRRLFERQSDCRDIVLDLKDVSLVDREVMRFLARCEADGMKLEYCAPYIREWMKREKIADDGPLDSKETIDNE